MTLYEMYIDLVGISIEFKECNIGKYNLKGEALAYLKKGNPITLNDTLVIGIDKSRLEKYFNFIKNVKK